MTDKRKRDLYCLDVLSELNDVLDKLQTYDISYISENIHSSMHNLEHDDLCTLDKEIGRFVAHMNFILSTFDSRVKNDFVTKSMLVKDDIQLKRYLIWTKN